MVRRVHLTLSDPRFRSAEWIEQLAADLDRRLEHAPQRIVFSPETAAVLPLALRTLAHKHFKGEIILEALDVANAMQQRTELLASGKSFDALKAAYDIMALTQPGWIVTLRRGHERPAMLGEDDGRLKVGDRVLVKIGSSISELLATPSGFAGLRTVSLSFVDTLVPR